MNLLTSWSQRGRLLRGGYRQDEMEISRRAVHLSYPIASAYIRWNACTPFSCFTL